VILCAQERTDPHAVGASLSWVGRRWGVPEIALKWRSGCRDTWRRRPQVRFARAQPRSSQFWATSVIIFVLFILAAAFVTQARAQTCLAADPFTSACLDQVDTFPLGNRIPLILVHGWNEQESVWNNLINSDAGSVLQSEYKIYRFSYQSNMWSLPNLAQALRIVLDQESFNDPQFGSQKISFVAHSLGGLIVRYFMSETTSLQQGPFIGLKGGERVIKLITLGTPHHGTPAANGPVRNAKAGPFWGSQLIGSDLPVFKLTPYNQINRNDLWWDNYDALWNGSYGAWGIIACPLGCPDTQNPELQLINNDTTYDKKLIAYADI
jgi:pimeloyl-ACP methyl ester carboxylesterase